MSKIKRIYVDPPSGWKYGFPKAVPDVYVTDGVITDNKGFNDWLNSEYPDEGMLNYLRMWVQEED